MPSKQTIFRAIRSAFPTVLAVYLFGSVAEGEANPKSDVDLGLLFSFEEARQRGSLALSEESFLIGKALGKEIDLLNLRLLSTMMQREVVQKGIRLFAASEDLALDYEARVLSSAQRLQEERKEIVQAFHQTKRAYLV